MNEPIIESMRDLVEEYKIRHPKSHFFDWDALKFFGERRSDMRLLKTRKKVTTAAGNTYLCYVVSSKQRKAPGGPKRVYHYFDMETLRQICAEE